MDYILAHAIQTIILLLLIFLGYRTTKKSSHKKRIILIIVFILVPLAFYLLSTTIPARMNVINPVRYGLLAISGLTSFLGLPLSVGIIIRMIKEYILKKKQLRK